MTCESPTNHGLPYTGTSGDGSSSLYSHPAGSSLFGPMVTGQRSDFHLGQPVFLHMNPLIVVLNQPDQDGLLRTPSGFPAHTDGEQEEPTQMAAQVAVSVRRMQTSVFFFFLIHWKGLDAGCEW